MRKAEEGEAPVALEAGMMKKMEVGVHPWVA